MVKYRSTTARIRSSQTTASEILIASDLLRHAVFLSKCFHFDATKDTFIKENQQKCEAKLEQLVLT